MPQIIPIKDMKDTTMIVRKCKESDEPIFVTKNGYGELVVMSMELYHQMRKNYSLIGDDILAELANESYESYKKGERGVDGDAFFSMLRERYGK